MNNCLYCRSLSLEEFLTIVNCKKYNYCYKCSFEMDPSIFVGENYCIAYLISKKYLCHTFYCNGKYEFYYNYDDSSIAKDVSYYGSLDKLNIFLYKYLKNIIFI